jgi:hypothetical protein
MLGRSQEDPMRHTLQIGAIALALAGGLTLAAAQDNKTGRDIAGPAQDANGPRGNTVPAGADPPPPNASPGSSGGPTGPLGATPSTTPSTLSATNAAADKLPLMAGPLPLSDEQKQKILSAVASAPAAKADAKPGQLLPYSVAMQELPPDVTRDIPAVRAYKYVKVSDGRVILVAPANRIVVGEISK